jgi:hypothetical protein
MDLVYFTPFILVSNFSYNVYSFVCISLAHNFYFYFIDFILFFGSTRVVLCVCVCVCVCVVLGFDLRVLHLLGRRSTTLATTQPGTRV